MAFKPEHRGFPHQKNGLKIKPDSVIDFNLL